MSVLQPISVCPSHLFFPLSDCTQQHHARLLYDVVYTSDCFAIPGRTFWERHQRISLLPPLLQLVQSRRSLPLPLSLLYAADTAGFSLIEGSIIVKLKVKRAPQDTLFQIAPVCFFAFFVSDANNNDEKKSSLHHDAHQCFLR